MYYVEIILFKGCAVKFLSHSILTRQELKPKNNINFDFE